MEAEMTKQATRTTAWDLSDAYRQQGERKRRTTKAKPYTPKQKDHFPNVVGFVYMSRYATAAQVQARFPQVFKNDRTCRRHLKQLADFGYLSTVDPSSTGPTWPLVYLCTAKGTGYLRENFKWELPDAREEARTLPSLEHELFLTEFQLATRATTAARHYQDAFHERRYFHQTKRLTYQPKRRRAKPKIRHT
jgi:hypothetical protein